MQAVLKNVPDDRLRAYIIWIPMRPADNRAAAEKRSGEFVDKRLTYYWDGDRVAGKLWQRVLSQPGPAWDIYLLYGAGTRWKTDPPAPDFWMSNPAGTSRAAPPLNAAEFEAQAKQRLGPGLKRR